LKVNLERGKLIDFPRQRDRLGDTFRTPNWIPIESLMIPSVKSRRRWESNPKRRDTLTLRGHSVFPRIAVKGMQPGIEFKGPVRGAPHTT